MNLAAAFVNGFVNCGFGVDKMMSENEDATRWFYKNKEYGRWLCCIYCLDGEHSWALEQITLLYVITPFTSGMLSAAASQGLVWRWDIDSGLAQCDRFLYVNDDFIKVCLLYLGSLCGFLT